MSKIVSVEFLETNGFSLESYPDGNFWVLLLAEHDYCLQADETRTVLTEDDCGWVEQLSHDDFVEAVLKTNRFISSEE